MTRNTAQLDSIELFAGAGGLALGMSDAGVRHRAIVEWNRYACETIRENRRAGHASVEGWPDPIEGDVTRFDYNPYEGISIISGGPPCQPFSMGGKHRAFLDARDMFPQAIRAVREARPSAFLFENVRGLTRPTFANYVEYIRLQLEFPSLTARPGEEWEHHLARLERHKTGGGAVEYRILRQVLDAANFGVPQRRHRVFFVGVRADLNRRFSFPVATHSYDRLLFDQFITGEYWEDHRIAKRQRPAPVAAVLGRISKLRDADPEMLGQRWQTVRDAIRDLPDPEKHPDCGIQAHVYQSGARSYPGHTGSPLDEPAKALKAGDHGVPGGENMLRRPDGSVRYFTVRESARIQCFPDDFAFAGSWGEAMRQLGNAVPVKLAAAVGGQLVRVLSQR